MILKYRETVSLNMQQQAEHVGSAADKMRYGASQPGTVTEHRIPNPMLHMWFVDTVHGQPRG